MKSQACSLQDLSRIGRILTELDKETPEHALLVRCAHPGSLPLWRGAYQVLQAVSEKIGLTQLKHVQPTHLYTIRRLRRKAPTDWPLWVERAEAKKWTVAELRKEMLLPPKGKAKVAGTIAGGDALEFLSGIKEGSVDLLLTDPPYMTDLAEDIHDFAARWLPLAVSRLKPTGRGYICTGAYPEELHAYLTTCRGLEGFGASQVLVWTYRNTLGPSPKLNYKINWQAIFYLRGPDALALDCPKATEQWSVQDINAPDGRRGERVHKWQKPPELAERFIRHATLPGDFVIDPFAGTGTFLLAAARLGRRAEGAERDPQMLGICRRRGLEVRHAG